MFVVFIVITIKLYLNSMMLRIEVGGVWTIKTCSIFQRKSARE